MLDHLLDPNGLQTLIAGCKSRGREGGGGGGGALAHGLVSKNLETQCFGSVLFNTTASDELY